MLLLKLALVPASILLATLAARRFGHAISGLLAGFPIIGGPIVAALLIDLPPARVADIAQATLSACPAAIAHIVCFAWLSRRLPWWGCLAGAAIAFFTVGSLMTASWMPAALAAAMALAGPFVAWAMMPRAAASAGAVHVPNGEVLMRVGAGFALAAAIILGSGHLPAAVSGLMLAWPISGSILPSFTLPVHGHAATVTLLRGFAIGLVGFVAFFAALVLLLRAWDSGPPAFAAATAVSALAGLTVHRIRQRARR